jgi:xanthine/CO dehydrogenase XdhC/CoxF family maturation factor
MLFTTGGQRAGSVSGGCLESDLLKKADWWTRSQGRVVKRYDTHWTDDAASEFGLGCEGVIDLLLEPVGSVGSGGLRRVFEERTSHRASAIVATVIAMEGISKDSVGARFIRFACGDSETDISCPDLADAVGDRADAALTSQRSALVTFTQRDYSADVFFEVVAPPARLAIYGTGYDAVPVARLAHEMGWDVTVIDLRGDHSAEARFVGTGAVVVRPLGVPACDQEMAVVMTHSYELDRMLLRNLLRQRLVYLGVLGPRERTQRLLAEVSTGGSHSCLHAPAGLDVGGDSPVAVALSIVAEIQAVFSARAGGMLRNRAGSIHQRKPENVALFSIKRIDNQVATGDRLNGK